MAGFMAKDVLFNAGEAFDITDLNNAQRFLHSLIADGVLARSCVGDDGFDVRMSQSFCYAIGNSGAPFENGSGTRTPNFQTGVIAQRPTGATFDGNDAQVLLYHLEADEPSVARPAATTDPRWDVLSVQLVRANADSQSRDFQDGATRALSTSSFNKQRRVEATFTWTLGVEAASPAEPAIPADHVKLAAFRVEPAMTLFDPLTDIRDYRMPIGPRVAYDVRGHAWTTVATPDADGILDLNPTESATAWCPIGNGARRLVSVSVSQRSSDPLATLELRRRLWSGSTSLQVTLADLIALSISTPAAFDDATFDVLSLDFPVWSNGHAAGYACDRAAPADMSAAGQLVIHAVADAVNDVAIADARFVLVG